VSNRRTFLKSAAMCTPGAMLTRPASFAQAAAPPPKRLPPGSIPVGALPQHFDVEPDIHNLENGYWGIMPKSVAQVYAEQTAYGNRTSSIWARNVLHGGACLAAGGREARESIAGMVGASPDEIAITRSGSDALQLRWSLLFVWLRTRESTSSCVQPVCRRRRLGSEFPLPAAGRSAALPLFFPSSPPTF
jgi:hypothetical protein